MAQNLTTGHFFQQGIQLTCRILAAQQGDGIHRGIPFEAVIDLTVHVDGYVGNQQQVAVDVHQLGFDAVFRLHQHAARNGQGAVQPCGHNHAAVFLRGKTGVGSGQLAVFLDLEGGAVTVAGGHHKALGPSSGDAECQHGAAAAGHIVLAAGGQFPAIGFGKAGITRLFQFLFNILRCMVDAGGSIQKGKQLLGSFIHILLLQIWQG